MGDGADRALDYAMTTWEDALNHRDSSMEEKYERGLCDAKEIETLNKGERMTEPSKSIKMNLQLPRILYEEFYKCFPRRGERSNILREIIRELVRIQSLEPLHFDELKKEFWRRLGKEDL